MTCGTCGREIHNSTGLCVYCVADDSITPSQSVQTGEVTPIAVPRNGQSAKPNPVAALLGLAIFAGTLWYFFGGGIENKVADDAVKEYEIAKRSGTKMDVCVHASLVAAAYLQAKDEAKYREWKATEKADCAVAGLPPER
jgi:hypothetical protein